MSNDVTRSTSLDRACASCSYENLPQYRSYRVGDTAPWFCCVVTAKVCFRYYHGASGDLRASSEAITVHCSDSLDVVSSEVNASLDAARVQRSITRSPPTDDVRSRFGNVSDRNSASRPVH